MSTRSNVLIKLGSTKIYLYRHHDGYPGGNGGDLAEKLIKNGNDGAAFIEDLISEKYDDGRAVWELTTDLHGDIEWLYVFAFNKFEDLDPKVWVVERSNEREDGYWKMISEEDAKKEIGLKGLVDMANKDRLEMNVRIADMNMKNFTGGEVRADNFWDLISLKEEKEVA